MRTDCSSLLPLLTEAAEVSHRWRSRSPGVVPALARIRTVLARRKLSLDAKHVRAHQPRESSTEAWLNDSVDRLARAAKSASRAWRSSDVRHGVRARGRHDPSFGARWDDTRGWVKVDLGASALLRAARSVTRP